MATTKAPKTSIKLGYRYFFKAEAVEYMKIPGYERYPKKAAASPARTHDGSLVAGEAG
jgi:hypothetical protein